MKTKYYCILMLAATVFLIVSCAKKEEPTETAETPVFSIKGNISQNTITLEAGKNAFYMNTYYTKDTQNVYEFIGDIKQTCSTCKQSLKIILRNYKQNISGLDYKVDSAFMPGNYIYNNTTLPTSEYLVNFSSQSTGTGTVNHFWDFGDGNTSSLANPTKTFYTKNATVSYTSSYSNGCSSTLTEDLYPLTTTIKATFSYSYIPFDTSTIEFSALDTTGSSTWNFGDGNISTVNHVQHTYTSQGLYKVCLFKFNGDSAKHCENIATVNYAGCKANFSYSSTEIVDVFRHSKITVEWTDENGVTYSSKNVTQPSTNYFTILSSSDYILNSNGQKTRTLKIKFNCLASNGTSTIELSNMEGTIAVAYP